MARCLQCAVEGDPTDVLTAQKTTGRRRPGLSYRRCATAGPSRGRIAEVLLVRHQLDPASSAPLTRIKWWCPVQGAMACREQGSHQGRSAGTHVGFPSESLPHPARQPDSAVVLGPGRGSNVVGFDRKNIHAVEATCHGSLNELSEAAPTGSASRGYEGHVHIVVERRGPGGGKPMNRITQLRWLDISSLLLEASEPEHCFLLARGLSRMKEIAP